MRSDSNIIVSLAVLGGPTNVKLCTEVTDTSDGETGTELDIFVTSVVVAIIAELKVSLSTEETRISCVFSGCAVNIETESLSTLVVNSDGSKDIENAVSEGKADETLFCTPNVLATVSGKGTWDENWPSVKTSGCSVKKGMGTELETVDGLSSSGAVEESIASGFNNSEVLIFIVCITDSSSVEDGNNSFSDESMSLTDDDSWADLNKSDSEVSIDDSIVEVCCVNEGVVTVDCVFIVAIKLSLNCTAIVPVVAADE